MALGDVRKGIEQLSRTRGWNPQEHLGPFMPPHTLENPSGIGRVLPDEPEHVRNSELSMPALPDPGIPSLARRVTNPAPGE